MKGLSTLITSLSS